MQIILKVHTRFGIQTTAFDSMVLALRAQRLAESQDMKAEIIAV